MSGGWVKLHRQAIENGWLMNHRLWSFWCYCLLKATHKQVDVTVGYQRIRLEPGQFIFGRKVAASNLKMTERQIRTCQNTLISTNNLSVKTTNKFSVITVVNWNTYQGQENENGQQSVSQTDQQPTSNRPQTRSKRIKEVNTSSFDDFYNAYPRKVGKASALKAWQKINPDSSLQSRILKALEWQAQQGEWQKENGKYIPHPATWLNGNRWEDEQPEFNVPTNDFKTAAELREMGL